MLSRGPIALVGDHGPLAEADPAVIRHLGAEPSDTAGDRWISLLPPTDSAGGPAVRARLALDVAAAGREFDVVEITGSDSARIARALRRTPAWAGVVDSWRAGAAVVAYGAAAMAVGGFLGRVRGPAIPGLALVPGLLLVPEIDGLGPEVLRATLARLAAPGVTVVGLDRRTALVGRVHDPGSMPPRHAFRPHGGGSAWISGPQHPRRVLSPLLLEVAA